MGFTSWTFIAFLIVVFALYWGVFGRMMRHSRHRLMAQNAFVVVASYVFYGWWDYRCLLLIVFTTLCSYASGRLIDGSSSRRTARAYTAANITVNLLILGAFKYYNFFATELSHLFGCNPDGLLLHVVLPVGISFYTFQALSYSIDVYRRHIAATRDAVAFAAYLAFFPQLVAGPIERATALLPQFQRECHFDYSSAIDGCRQMLWGFFKKIAVADTCAVVVDAVYGAPSSVSAVAAITAMVLFSIQIYADFSGYSDIAIGCARLFGISLRRNFNNPYFSRDIAEFWRRWHISLTAWFRDYVYIPLGGSRPSVDASSHRPELRRRALILRNTLIIFLLSALWHGANWTFVAWGMYHALLFVPLIMSGRNRRYTSIPADGQLLPTAREVAQIALTFALVSIGWVFFRADSLQQAFSMFGSLAHWADPSLPVSHGQIAKPLLTTAVMITSEWFTRSRQHALQVADERSHRALRIGSYYALLLLMLLVGGKEQVFIYFQF